MNRSIRHLLESFVHIQQKSILKLLKLDYSIQYKETKNIVANKLPQVLMPSLIINSSQEYLRERPIYGKVWNKMVQEMHDSTICWTFKN